MRKFFILTIITSIVTLSGCGGGKVSRPDLQDGQISESDISNTILLAEDYTQSGKFLDAALQYSRLATISATPDKQHYQLLAADALIKGRYMVQALQLLDEIDVDSLDESFQLRKTLITADIALGKNQPEMTLKILDKLKQRRAKPELQKRIHKIRANAYEMAGKILDSARELTLLEPLITEIDERRINQRAILAALSKMPSFALQQLITEPPTDPISGWLEISQIIHDYQTDPATFEDKLRQWRLKYPQHSALNEVISKPVYREIVEAFKPTQIALLLPAKKQQFAKAAAAIKNGLLSAYFAHPVEANRPTLRIYDTGSEDEDFLGVYKKAVAEGADFIIGPLDKPSVNMLSTLSSLDVPTLALNYLDVLPGGTDSRSPKNLFQFGLSPEDEAAQVAERAWLNGFNRAIILVPQGKWGERVQNAFSTRWQEMGGVIAESQTYDARKNDFSASIRKVLNIDESERRQSLLHATLNHKTFFIPRRRQDVDFIFIGAFPRQARQLRPQFKFHHAADLPVYATSHIYTGTVNSQMDRDMNGVFFGDMPWVLPKLSRHPDLKKKISKLWPDSSEKYLRLYALGIDAYNIIPSLNKLISFRSEYYKGETGNLYLDNDKRINRRLVWLGFKRGVPKVLDSLN